MEQFLMNVDGVNALINQVGFEFDGAFIVTDETPEALDEILKLVISDNNCFTTRRHLALSNVIEKSLVPLILYLCEDTNDDAEEKDTLTEEEKLCIYSKAVNLFVSLTLPLDSLCTDPGSLPAKEDVYLLYDTTKKAFLDRNLCEAVVHTSMKLIDPLHNREELDMTDCQTLNSTILLLRNVLYLSETGEASDEGNNELEDRVCILRWLLKAGLTDVLLDLMEAEQHQFWSLSLVQLLSLLYKDQRFPVRELVYKCPSICTVSSGGGATVCSEDAFLCENDTFSETDTNAESSEDSNDGSALKPPSDDQDGSPTFSEKGIVPPHNSEESVDQTYEPVAEDAVPVMWERLADLEKSVNYKLVNWQVSEKLMDFSKAFLKRGFANIVLSLKEQLITNPNQGVLNLFFSWVVGHFLELARQLKMPFLTVRTCLSVDVVGFLVYLGVSNAEDIIMCQARNTDVSQALRMNRLTIRAMLEILLTVKYFNARNIRPEEKYLIRSLQGHMMRMKDLRQSFLFYIRHLKPDTVCVEHLGEVVCTNHQFLLVVEEVLSEENKAEFDIMEHIHSFATSEIMQQYGILLERYEKNSRELNESVLNMMHHVAGDCNQSELLLQFSIVCKLSEIAEDTSLAAEYVDLAYFVMERFMMLATSNPRQFSEHLLGNEDGDLRIDVVEDTEMWPQEEMDELFELHGEFADSPNKLEGIRDGLREKNIIRSTHAIAQQLIAQGLESRDQTEATGASEQVQMDHIVSAPTANSVGECVEELKKRKFECHLVWIQEVLLELCFIKLGGRSLSQGHVAEEPIPLYYALQNKSVPVVAYTLEQEQFLRNDVFINLLQLMGFHQAEDSGKFFCRIPSFWTPEDLLFKAQQLGSVDIKKQKFTMNDVEQNSSWWSSHVVRATTHTSLHPAASGGDGRARHSGDLWHMFVKHCNISARICSSHHTEMEQ